jgi:uncharacterized cupredoxin-like copper-binding protein
LLLVGLLLFGVLGACGDDDDDDAGGGDTSGESADASKVTVKTQEYAFDLAGTTSFEGGLVELTLDNTAGKESHEIQLTRLDEGKTLDDYKAAQQQQGPPPAWQHLEGGPGPVSPGSSAAYTGNLEPGTYVLTCDIPGEDGQPHYAKGMITSVTVTDGDTGALPEADATLGVEESDTDPKFQFTGLDQLESGDQLVKFENNGKQPHHVAMVALADGKTAADVLAFFSADSPPPGPPPFTGIPGAFTAFAPGGEGVRAQTLEPGSYAVLCFVPDSDGVPHAAKGMAQDFKVS